MTSGMLGAAESLYSLMVELALGTTDCQPFDCRIRRSLRMYSGGKSVPTYAYGCKDCGHAFDIQQSFSDDSLTVCPECGGNLRKKFNSVGVVFKGSGFYRTDSRSTSSSVPAAASAGNSDSSSTNSTNATASPAPAATDSGASKSPATAGATN